MRMLRARTAYVQLLVFLFCLFFVSKKKMFGSLNIPLKEKNTGLVHFIRLSDYNCPETIRPARWKPSQLSHLVYPLTLLQILSFQLFTRRFQLRMIWQSKQNSEFLNFMIISELLIKNASKWAQTSLCLVQWFLRYKSSISIKEYRLSVKSW